MLAEIGDGLMAGMAMRTILEFPAKRSVRSLGYVSGMRLAGLEDLLGRSPGDQGRPGPDREHRGHRRGRSRERVGR